MNGKQLRSKGGFGADGMLLKHFDVTEIACS